MSTLIRNILPKKAIIAITILASTLILYGNEQQRNIFGGGMAIQGGLVSVQTPGPPAKGLIRGLGGKLHFNIGNHFRVGGTGASITLNYNHPGIPGSYFSFGYGGATVEGVLPVRDRVLLSAGALLGGGKSKNLHIVSTKSKLIDSAYLTKTGTFLLSPIITIEYKLNKTLHLMLSSDYLFGNSVGTGISLGGPKVILGVLFNK